VSHAGKFFTSIAVQLVNDVPSLQQQKLPCLPCAIGRLLPRSETFSKDFVQKTSLSKASLRLISLECIYPHSPKPFSK
jgi:hypothetical protein